METGIEIHLKISLMTMIVPFWIVEVHQVYQAMVLMEVAAILSTNV